MSETLLDLKVYKFRHDKKVVFKKNSSNDWIYFKNGDIIKVATFGDGCFGFSAIWFQISIETKDEKGEPKKSKFEEYDRTKEGTPIKDFVTENKGSLFEFLGKF